MRDRSRTRIYTIHPSNAPIQRDVYEMCTSLYSPPSPLPTSISFPFLLTTPPPSLPPSTFRPLSLGRGRGLDLVERGEGVDGERVGGGGEASEELTPD